MATQEVEEIAKHAGASVGQALTMPTSSPPDQTAEPPLFSKDTLYHASLCCHVVNTCNDLNYEFHLNSTSHQFEEASMSIRGMQKAYVERYMIAKHTNDTYFVAFRIDDALSMWTRKYASFSDGLEKQINRIPIQFFLELLNSKKRLVLTGFSFGGMMVSHIAAILWRRSSVDKDVLEKNIICITFGQPLIPIPSVEETIKDYPQFEATVHAVYDKDDFFPRVLYYYNIGCQLCHDHGDQILGQSNDPLITQMIQAINKQTASDHPQTTSVLDFSSPFARRFLLYLLFIEQIPARSVEMGNARISSFLKEFNRLLSEIIPHADKYNPGQAYVGNGYLMTSTDGEGMQWASMPCKTISERGILRLTSRDTELDIASFKKHDVITYTSNLSRSYLEREPERYTPAARAVEKVGHVGMLNPNPTRIELQIYPNEHVLVVEGENLWFCHKLQLGDYSNMVDIDTNFQNVTQRMIRFNFPPSERLIGLVAEGVVKLILNSHFANPVRQNIQVVQANY